MSDATPSTPAKAPWHLWAIGIVGLLWNAIGATDYTMTQTHNEAYLSAVSPQQLEFIYGVPAWAVAAWAIGPWVFAAAAFGLALAWAYSAPPLRLKQNGWWGNAACGLCYEGLAWITGAAVMAGGAPSLRSLILAALYSAGAHGIMTLNDFKSIDGDKRMGIGSLPVQLGPQRAAQVACWAMALPQVAVIALLVDWGQPLHAAGVGALLAAQVAMPVLDTTVDRVGHGAPSITRWQRAGRRGPSR